MLLDEDLKTELAESFDRDQVREPSMRSWATTLRVISFIWLYLASFLILAAITGVLMKQGEAGVRELLSPFNLNNWFIVLLILLPGLGLLLLSSKLKSRTQTLD